MKRPKSPPPRPQLAVHPAPATAAGHIRRLAICLMPAAVCLLAGCPQYADPTVPEPIRRVREPTSRNEYFIYVPSRYDARIPTPMVVLCHGTTPWDTALREMRDWVGLAEEKNFIAVAPKLAGTRGDMLPPAAKQIELQHGDEKTILRVVQHVRGGHNIAMDRIFLSGWSAGGYAVLHTGLRHPEVFRALAIMQGNFNAAFLGDVVGHIDPYQPVFVLYGTTDVLTGSQGRDCVQWLYDHNAYVFDGKVPGPHRAHPQLAQEFFERILREVPWLRIRAYAANERDPYTVQFKVRSSFEPFAFQWDFGDGEQSPVANPTHTYREPGTYEVKLISTSERGKSITRKRQIKIPFTTLDTTLDE